MRRIALLVLAASVVGGIACGISLDPITGVVPVADGGRDVGQPPVVDAGLDGGAEEDAPAPEEDAGVLAPSNVAVGFEADAGLRDFPITVSLISTGVGGAPPSLVPLPSNAPTIALETTLTGETVAVLRVHDFTVATDLDVVGEHPLVVIATGDVRIDAVVKAGVDSLGGPGPGGFFGGQGPGKGGDGAGGTGSGSAAANANSGGGGGGHGAPGGVGGDSSSAGTVGGLAGTMYPASMDDVRLVGGAGGGSGIPNEATCSAPGGSGGGALQISALGPIVVGAAGRLDVGGGGGSGGCQNGGVLGSGAGGGAGGLILLESRQLRIEGFVSANGGGGGGGATSGKSGQPGAVGPRAADVAAGGTSGVVGSYVGGVGGAAVPGADGGVDGGAANVPPGKGDVGAASGEGAGGGGAYGRILLRSRSAGITILGTGGVSPTARRIPF